MQRYLGASNFKEHIRSTLSACGCFVIAGSEDGYAYVWNTETGQSSLSGQLILAKLEISCFPITVFFKDKFFNFIALD